MPHIPCDENDRIILAKTVYAEARGEPREGQIAVIWVIINRFLANWSSSIAAVCRAPSQFECWNGKKDIHIGEQGAYENIHSLVNQILHSGEPKDPTDGCDHYNNPAKETASWVNNVDHKKTIGNHYFYKSRG